MPRPKIVYIAPKPPYPLTSGMAIRQFHLLQAYAKWGRVHLITFYTHEAQRNVARSLESTCERIHFVSTKTMVGDSIRHGSRPRRVFGRLMGRRPTVATWSYSREMTALINDFAKDADIVHVARLSMASQAEWLLATRRARPAMVLDLDDVESSLRLRQLRHGRRAPVGQHLYGYYDAARLWAYQTTMVRRFDRVFVCSERDRQRLAWPNVVVVPNGTHVPVSPMARRADSRTIMFCGLLSYSANIDGVRFLIGSVLPHVHRVMPEARLVIVGRAPTPEIRALHDGKTIIVAGDVPTVGEYYASSTIAAVPLRFGGGTRIKILEAWAHGVPVVSTTIGCEGLDGVAGRHLMVADRPQDFADHCVALLRSPELRARVALEGWRLVSDRYRWEDIGVLAVVAVEELLRDHKGLATAANKTLGRPEYGR